MDLNTQTNYTDHWDDDDDDDDSTQVIVIFILLSVFGPSDVIIQ